MKCNFKGCCCLGPVAGRNTFGERSGVGGTEVLGPWPSGSVCSLAKTTWCGDDFSALLFVWLF